MSPLVAAILRDAFTMACITALAIAHVIPGSTAVALLAPYLAIRAILAHKRPPPGAGGGVGDDKGDVDVDGPATLRSAPPTLRTGEAPPRQGARIVLDLLPFLAAPVALVLPFSLPDVEHLLAGAEQLRQRARAVAQRPGWRAAAPARDF